jgi:hypothetical protein
VGVKAFVNDSTVTDLVGVNVYTKTVISIADPVNVDTNSFLVSVLAVIIEYVNKHGTDTIEKQDLRLH